MRQGVSRYYFPKQRAVAPMSGFLDLILRPGGQLMGRMSLRVKLATLVCMLIVPLAALVVAQWRIQPPGQWGLGGAVLAALVIAYILMAFYRSLMQSVSSVKTAVHAGSSGDLTVLLSVAGSDELAQIGHDLELMNQDVSGLVGQVRSQTVLVSMAGEKLAIDSRELSRRTPWWSRF